jgi:hypothetical protein
VPTMRVEVLIPAAVCVLLNYLTHTMIDHLDRLPCGARNRRLSIVLRAIIGLSNLLVLATVLLGKAPGAVRWLAAWMFFVFDVAMVFYLTRVHDDHGRCASHASPTVRVGSGLLYYIYVLAALGFLMNASVFAFMWTLGVFYYGV